MSGYGEILRELCPDMPEMDIPEFPRKSMKPREQNGTTHVLAH
jgi:hypothetical protein